jgi:hypothetical protein
LTPVFIHEINFEHVFGSVEADSAALWRDTMLKNHQDRYHFLMSYL